MYLSMQIQNLLKSIARDKEKLEQLLVIANKLENSGRSPKLYKELIRHLNDNGICVLPKETICEMRDEFVSEYPYKLDDSEDELEAIKRRHYKYYIEQLEESLKGGLPAYEIPKWTK